MTGTSSLLTVTQTEGSRGHAPSSRTGCGPSTSTVLLVLRRQRSEQCGLVACGMWGRGWSRVTFVGLVYVTQAVVLCAELLLLMRHVALLAQRSFWASLSAGGYSAGQVLDLRSACGRVTCPCSHNHCHANHTTTDTSTTRPVVFLVNFQPFAQVDLSTHTASCSTRC